jgi:hypothetical protein
MPFGRCKRFVHNVLLLFLLPGMVDAVPKHHYLVAIAGLVVALVIGFDSFDRAAFHRTIPVYSVQAGFVEEACHGLEVFIF